MQCPRCEGLMTLEEFRNAASEGMPWSYEGWRCLYCGEVVDPLILMNRMKVKSHREEPVGAGSASR